MPIARTVAGVTNLSPESSHYVNYLLLSSKSGNIFLSLLNVRTLQYTVAQIQKLPETKTTILNKTDPVIRTNDRVNIVVFKKKIQNMYLL